MGRVNDRLVAMQSNGSRVVTLVSDNLAGDEDCRKYFTKVLRWVNFKYYKDFRTIGKRYAHQAACELISTGELLDEYKKANNVEITDGLLITLQECVMWSAYFNGEDKRYQLRWAYVADAGTIDAVRRAEIINNKIYNCMIMDDIRTEFPKYTIEVDRNKRSLDIINISEDTYDVALCSTKADREEWRDDTDN